MDVRKLRVDEFVPGTPWSYRRFLGRGGMGDVLQVEKKDPPLARAMKLLREPLAQRPELVRRFRDEAKILEELAHPNIVRMTDFGTTADGTPYILMPLLDGITVGRMLRAYGGPLPHVIAHQIIVPSAAAIHYAHSRGIVHRDFKPDNIFIHNGNDGPDLNVVVCDFGIAELISEGTASVSGTLMFMAPEQLRGERVTAATDWFAAGVTLYQMLTGRFPWPDLPSYEATCATRFSRRPARPSQYVVIPPLVEDVILAALEPDPRNRPGTYHEFVANLSALASSGQASRLSRRTVPTLAQLTDAARSTTVDENVGSTPVAAGAPEAGRIVSFASALEAETVARVPVAKPIAGAKRTDPNPSPAPAQPQPQESQHEPPRVSRTRASDEPLARSLPNGSVLITKGAATILLGGMSLVAAIVVTGLVFALKAAPGTSGFTPVSAAHAGTNSSSAGPTQPAPPPGLTVGEIPPSPIATGVAAPVPPAGLASTYVPQAGAMPSVARAEPSSAPLAPSVAMAVPARIAAPRRIPAATDWDTVGDPFLQPTKPPAAPRQASSSTSTPAPQSATRRIFDRL